MARCSAVWPWRHLAHPDRVRGPRAGAGGGARSGSRVPGVQVPTPATCDQCHRDPVLHAATMAAAASTPDQPWSPIVGGRALLPPLLGRPQLLLHSGLHTAPGLSLARADPAPAPGPS